jgi:hypothetical protein
MGCDIGTRRGRAGEFYELAPRADSVRRGEFVGHSAANPGRREGSKPRTVIKSLAMR